jgi:hypothetical protein
MARHAIPTTRLFLPYKNKISSVVEAYGWTGTKGLASLNNGQYVYAIQGGYLWRTSVTGGSTAIGPADWQNAQYFFARNKTF